MVALVLIDVVAGDYSLLLIWLLQQCCSLKIVGDMVAKTGGVVVVPIVKQALSWIHCAFFATLLALNFSLVGTCKLFTIVHRGHSVLRARQLSWEEWSVVSCFELSPHYCGGSAQAVHRQCTCSALQCTESKAEWCCGRCPNMESCRSFTASWLLHCNTHCHTAPSIPTAICTAFWRRKKTLHLMLTAICTAI